MASTPPPQIPRSPRLSRPLVLLGALVALALGVSWIMERWHYTVVAGSVSGSLASGLSGTFQMDFAGISPSATAIESSKKGGACIVIRATDVFLTGAIPASCTMDKDCESLKPQVDAYYCDREDVGACWVKPKGMSDRLCNSGIQLEDGQSNPVPVATKVAPIPNNVVKNNASARIVACINKPGIDPRVSGCGASDGPDRLEVMGPIATIN